MPKEEVKSVNVADLFSDAGQKQYVGDTALVTAGIADMWALIRKLMASNLISDAVVLMDMWTNDGKYTLLQFKTAIRAALSKLNIFNDNQPVAPRLSAGVEDGTVMGKAPTAEDVMRHLVAKGIKTQFLPPAMIWALIELGIRFGLPFLEKLIEKILVKQNVKQAVTFADLLDE